MKLLEVGLIQWFDFEKGFGVIETPNNGEFFIHGSNLQVELKDLFIYAPVVFVADFENGKNTAKKCRFPKDSDDLATILLLIGNNRNLKIKTKMEQRNRSGSIYVSKELITYDVLDICLSRIFKMENSPKLFTLINSSYLSIIESDIDFDYITYFQLVTKYIKQRKTDGNEDLLLELYRFYGNNINEEILFVVWKSKNFQFIDKTDFEDYEIPSFVLISNAASLEVADLKRIREYENGDEICLEIVLEKLHNLIDEPYLERIIKGYEFLSFVTNEIKNQELRNGLNQLLFKKVNVLIESKLSTLPAIEDEIVLSKYEEVKCLIPDEIDEKYKLNFIEKIHQAIKDKSSDNIIVKLWLSNYIEEVDINHIIDFLTCDNSNVQDKQLVLSKIQLSEAIETILVQIHKRLTSIKVFELVEQFVISENTLPNNFKIVSDLIDYNSEEDLVGFNLFQKYQSIVVQNVDEQESCDLFLKGWLDEYPVDYILYVVEDLNLDELKIILNHKNTNKDFKFQLLKKLGLNLEGIQPRELLQLAEEFLSAENQYEIEQIVLGEMSDEEWFALWKSKATTTIRKDFLLQLFDDSEAIYNEITHWVKNGVVSNELISEWLYEKLGSINEITDRIEFYTSFFIIQKLNAIDEKLQQNIAFFSNKFHTLILWHLGLNVDFDFNTLKGKFIYFKPSDQVSIFKRLFYLKHKGELNFTFNELDEIVRADTDLYLANEKFHNDFVLDISTHILIEAIKSYQLNNTFLFESDLILKDLKNNSGRKFKIENYFEKCPGRYISEHNWQTNGEIKRLIHTIDNQDHEFFKIEFDYNKDIVEGVKKITGRSYNSSEKSWRVPVIYENEVLEFAKEFTFFINLPNGFHFSNNPHLATFKRDEVPTGIKFCEGRKSNKKHNKLKCDFWWCKNQECFQFAESNNLSQEFTDSNVENKKVWESYKLIDILRILKIDIDEYKGVTEEYIPDGNYYIFMGHINAFNRLVEKLYCNECNELLYPLESSHFALYRDTKFNCVNKSCKEHQKTVYLNSCLNGECNTVIDSRVSKRCNHGLYICENCGTCCSQDMFKRRLDNLILVGGYIHPDLVRNVEQQKGHLEKAEYYCYKCSGMMTQNSKQNYRCNDCNVSYSFSKFKWLDKKWTRIAQRRKDYPING